MSALRRGLGPTLALVCAVSSPRTHAQAASSVSTSTTGTTAEKLSDLVGSAGPSYAVRVVERRVRASASDLRFDFEPRTASGPGQTGADLLARAPGVVITQHSGEGKAHQIFLRGFDAVHGQDVEIHVGGIPVNEPSHLHGQGYADLHFLVAETVRSMHVLEGPFSARQGDFAIAGSFDFELGLRTRGVLARGSAGSFGAARGLVAWGPERLSEASFVAAEIARSEGFGPARAHERAAALAQLEWPLVGGWSLRALGTTYQGRFESAGVLRLSDYQSGRVGFFDAPLPGQGGESGRHQVLLELRTEADEHRGLVSTYLVARDLLLRQNFTGFLASPTFGDTNEQRNGTLTVGGRATYQRYALWGGLDLDLGLVWRHDRSDQRQARLRAQDRSVYRTEVDATLALTDVGVFAEASVDLGEAWTVRTGVRAEALTFEIEDRLRAAATGRDGRRQTFGLRAAPRLGLSWHPEADWALFLSYGQGFRSPSALSLSDRERPSFTVVHAGELGARWTPTRAVAATVAAFTTYLDEELQFDHASATTLVSGATIRGGASLLLALRPFEGSWAELAVTYTHSRNLDLGTPVAFAPRWVVRGELELARPLGRLWEQPLSWFGRTEVSVVADRPLPFSETAEPVLLTELSAGVGLGPVSLSAELYNLLDLRWRDGEFVYASNPDPTGPTSLLPARHFTAGRPFTAQLTLTLETE